MLFITGFPLCFILLVTRYSAVESQTDSGNAGSDDTSSDTANGGDEGGQSSIMFTVAKFFIGYLIGGAVISVLALVAFAACKKKLKTREKHFLMLTNPEFTIYDGKPMTEEHRKQLNLNLAGKRKRDNLGQSSYTQTNKRAVAFDDDDTSKPKTDPMCTVCGQQMCVTCGKRMNADHVSHSPGTSGLQNSEQLGKEGKADTDKADEQMTADSSKKESRVSFKGMGAEKDGNEVNAGHTQSEHDRTGGKDGDEKAGEGAGPSLSKKDSSRRHSSHRSLKGFFLHGSKHKDSDKSSIRSQPVTNLAVAPREDDRSLQSLPASSDKHGKRKKRPWKHKRNKNGEQDGSDVNATGRSSGDLTNPETTDSGSLEHGGNCDAGEGKRKGARPRGRKIRYRTICETCKACGCGGCVVFDID